MKKKLCIILILIFILSSTLLLFSACNSENTDSSKNTFVIYNWEDYIAPSLLDDFKNYYKAKTGQDLNIIYSTFDTNETMMTKVLKGDAKVDVIAPSEYAIQKLMQANLLENLVQLKQNLMPTVSKMNINFDNFSNFEPSVIKAIEEIFGNIKVGNSTQSMTDYIAPYMWGTLGLMYNTKIISQKNLKNLVGAFFGTEATIKNLKEKY